MMLEGEGKVGNSLYGYMKVKKPYLYMWKVEGLIVITTSLRFFKLIIRDKEKYNGFEHMAVRGEHKWKVEGLIEITTLSGFI